MKIFGKKSFSSKPETSSYVLFNKNTPVLTYEYDQVSHRILSIGSVDDAAYAPPGILSLDGSVSLEKFNTWWKSRSVPASRQHLRGSLEALRAGSVDQLIEESHGLSLDDCYWFELEDESLAWADINFFDNEFSEDVGEAMLGYHPESEKPNFLSPNGSVNGVQRKAWKIVDGKRMLFKESIGLFGQTAFNEKIACALYARIFNEEEFAPYKVCIYEGGSCFSACPNFLRPNEELISATQINGLFYPPEHKISLNELLSAYEKFGAPGGFTESLSKMFVADYILANTDRHFGNFGVMRDCETLEITRLAPVYDSGSSLFFLSRLESPDDYRYQTKPFDPRPVRQLQLFQDYLSWFDTSVLSGFTDDVTNILMRNSLMPEDRVEKLCAFVDDNIKFVEHLARENQKGQHAFFGFSGQEGPHKSNLDISSLAAGALQAEEDQTPAENKTNKAGSSREI